VRFSIWPAASRGWDEILELARHGEATGWDGVYFADHFMPHGGFGPTDDPTTSYDGNVLECWAVIAALAASVPRVRLGTLVSSVTFRHPAVIANAAAAVDSISQGRLALGIGAGWQLNEHLAYGLALGSVRERLDRFEEACQVVSSLLRKKRTTFAGEYYHITDAPNQPPPVQQRLPILIGGSGEKRTMRIAARYADEWNCWSTPQVLAAKTAVLRAHCEAIGRSIDELRISTQAQFVVSNDQAVLSTARESALGPTMVGTPEEIVDAVGRWRQAGAGEIIVPDPGGPLSAATDAYDLFATEIAAHFAPPQRAIS
jgi:F420-dependent oxidoreductase-like protein